MKKTKPTLRELDSDGAPHPRLVSASVCISQPRPNGVDGMMRGCEPPRCRGRIAKTLPSMRLQPMTVSSPTSCDDDCSFPDTTGRYSIEFVTTALLCSAKGSPGEKSRKHLAHHWRWNAPEPEGLRHIRYSRLTYNVLHVMFRSYENCNAFEQNFEELGSKFGWKKEYDQHFEGLEEFKYEPIKTNRSIRLIRLNVKKRIPLVAEESLDNFPGPGAWTFETQFQPEPAHEPISLIASPVDFEFRPLQVSIIEASLDRLPDFETVSYVWGPADTRAVICDGKLLRVSRNCVLALYHICFGLNNSVSGLFWIDQICINQTDLDEKMQQVSAMSLIYGSSHRTIAWLGEASPWSRRLFDEYEESHDSFCSYLSYRPVRPEALHEFAQDPYFTRGWILQEAALARNMLLLCGKYAIPWMSFHSLEAACKGARNDQTITGHKVTSEASTRFISLRQQNGDRMNQKMDLTDTLRLALTVSVKDEKDRLYALFGLSDVLSKLAGPPDYSITVLEVWLRFYDSLICSLGPDSCLLWQLICIYANDRSWDPQVQRHLPSWMPDFSRGIPPRRLRCLTYKNALLKCCSNASSALSSSYEKTRARTYSPSPRSSNWTIPCHCSFIGELSDVLWKSIFSLAQKLRSDPNVRAQI